MKRLIILFCYLLLAAAGSSEEIVAFEQGLDGYSGTADATIYADRPDNANGGHHLIYSGATVGSVRRTLIRFDLASLPQDTPTRDAELRLTLDFSGLEARADDVYTLHRLTAGWGEGAADSGDPGGLGAPANPGDATWRARFFPDALWGAAGGDYLTTPSAELVIGRWESVNTEKNVYTFSGAALAQDIRAWIADPAANFGWILIGPENGSRNARRFHSSEAEAIPGARPRLTLTINHPASIEDRIVNHLLGLSDHAQGLDLSADGAIDAADLIQAIAP